MNIQTSNNNISNSIHRIRGGKLFFGLWSKNIEKIVDQSLMVIKWSRYIKFRFKSHKLLHIIDAGCGNATNSYPVAVELAKSNKKINFYLIDNQKDAIDSAKTILSKVSVPKNLCLFYLKQNLATIKVNKPIHGIYCNFVLHFFSPNKIEKSITNFRRNLVKGGLLFISVPSIFDTKNIECFPNQPMSKDKLNKRLNTILKLTNNGKSSEVMKGLDGFPTRMYFFTESALSYLLNRNGFKIKKIRWERNLENPNGLSKKYSETIIVIAEKV